MRKYDKKWGLNIVSMLCFKYPHASQCFLDYFGYTAEKLVNFLCDKCQDEWKLVKKSFKWLEHEFFLLQGKEVTEEMRYQLFLACPYFDNKDPIERKLIQPMLF